MASKDDSFNLKWRAYIEFRTKLNIQCVLIHNELQEILGMDCPSRSTIERWAARFRSGDTDVADLHRSGRPISVSTPDNIAIIGRMVMEDRFLTVDQIAHSMEMSSGAIHSILTIRLGYRSICGKWVPHILSEKQRLTRMNTAKKLLETYDKCDSRRLSEIITGDETWVPFSTPYSEYKMRSWVKGDEKPAQVPRPDFRNPKVMYTIFFNSGGIVLQLPSESGRSINATYFTQKILPNLIKNVNDARPKAGMRGIKLLIDNASSHTARLTKNFLESERIELLPHPPYSPDLAPCDFWLFPKLKIYLQGKEFDTRQALGTALYQYFKSIPEEEYRKVFFQWVERLRKCVSVGGDYFE